MRDNGSANLGGGVDATEPMNNSAQTYYTKLTPALYADSWPEKKKLYVPQAGPSPDQLFVHGFMCKRGIFFTFGGWGSDLRKACMSARSWSDITFWVYGGISPDGLRT